MKFVSLLILLLLGATIRANAQDTYSTYTNARFGTSIEYPSNLLLPQPESENGDGRRFVSRDGAIELTVYGSCNVLNLSISGAMNRAQHDWKSDKGRVSFWKAGKNWYVLSGYIGDDIFYEKALLVGDVIHTAIWQYPQSLRKRVDAPLTRSVHSLTAWKTESAPKATTVPDKKPTTYRNRRHGAASRLRAPRKSAKPVANGY